VTVEAVSEKRTQSFKKFIKGIWLFYDSRESLFFVLRNKGTVGVTG
jgi:hypothetical protein